MCWGVGMGEGEEGIQMTVDAKKKLSGTRGLQHFSSSLFDSKIDSAGSFVGNSKVSQKI